MKLYLVTLKGMTYSSTTVAYGTSYVIAEDAQKAVDKVQSYLNEKNIGFRRERELDSVTLLADSTQYPDCGCKLYL